MPPDVDNGGEVLGSGIAFPLQLAGGKVGMNSSAARVQQSIRLILSTGVGERIMRPEFGGNLERLAFESLTPVTMTHVQQQVRETLVRFEPRIELLDVTVATDVDAGMLTVGIQYRLRQTDSIFNMVYPFYLERGER